jgi:hypothetical protein
MRLLALAVTTLSLATAQTPDGAAVLSAACTGCHNLRIIANARRSRASWSATVGDMIQRGAPVYPEEMKILIDYLAQTVGPQAATANPAKEEQKKTDIP